MEPYHKKIELEFLTGSNDYTTREYWLRTLVLWLTDWTSTQRKPLSGMAQLTERSFTCRLTNEPTAPAKNSRLRSSKLSRTKSSAKSSKDLSATKISKDCF